MKKIYLLVLTIFAICNIAFSQSNAVTYSFPSGNCPPAVVNLNMNYNGAYYYVWFYSDGSSDTAYTSNHNHLFTNGGSHYASCSVYDVNWMYLYNGYTYFNLEGVQYMYTYPFNAQVCPNDEIEFHVAYQQTGASFTFDFGDGTIVSGNNNYARHAYATLGNYNVTCTATFPNCTSSNTVLNTTVSVQNGLPVTISNQGANIFDAQPNTACPGDLVHAGFVAENVYDYYVDFGDGYSSNNDLNHSYTSSGTYTITLTAINGCNNSLTITDTVQISTNLTVANPPYFQSYNGICPQTDIYFSAGVGYSQYSWNFGNGQTSTLSYPKTKYNSVGVYPVTLTVTNGCGLTATYTDSVKVINTIPVNSVSIYMPDTLCVNQPAYVELHTNGATSYSTNFGNGQVSTTKNSNVSYSAPGVYTVTTIASNGCNNTATFQTNVNVLANAGMDQDAFQFMAPIKNTCLGDTSIFVVTPESIGTYYIDFGDGSFATQPDVTNIQTDGLKMSLFKHKYSALGTYNVSCKITSDCGGELTKYTTANITTNASLGDVGVFYDNSKVLCYQNEITFGAAGGNNYLFDFGDGTEPVYTNQIVPFVKHKFSQPGTYLLKVTVTNGCGVTDTVTEEINLPDTRITVSTTSVNASCGQKTGKAIAIINYVANPPLTYSWTNGDKGLVADTLYSGLYEITVTDKNGCSTHAMATVSDAQAPTILVSNKVNVTCNGGNNGAIDLTVFGGAAPYTYQWSNGATVVDINNLIAGPYEIVVTDANGCIATKSIIITEPNPFNINFNVTSAQCGSFDGEIQTTVTPPNPNYLYIWDNGSTSSTNSFLASGVYHLILLDENSCIKEEDVVVNDIGGPNVAIDSVSTINCGSSGSSIYATGYEITLPPNNGYQYVWTPGNVSSDDLLNVAPGTYTLTTTNSVGCKTIKLVDVEIPPMIENPLCLVTVDTTTYTNKVVWESVAQPGIASYNIYRESSQAGLFYLVGNVDKDSLHQWIDPVADPSVRGWRYKLTAVGTCGQESQQSSFHKTIHLTVNSGVGSNWNLIWDNYIGQTHPTFYIWRYTDTNGWEKIDSLASTYFSYTDQNAPAGASVINYQIEAGPMLSCDPTRGPINTSRSNIRTTSARLSGIDNADIIDNGIYAYPNPSTGLVNFKTSMLLNKDVVVNVVDALGQVVSSFVHKANTYVTQANLNNLSSGIYFIQANVESKIIAKKIMIEN